MGQTWVDGFVNTSLAPTHLSHELIYHAGKVNGSYLSHKSQEGAEPNASFVPKNEYRMI